MVGLEGTFNTVKNSIYHGFWCDTIKQLLDCIQITPILHTSLPLGGSNLYTVRVDLLDRKGYQRWRNIVHAVKWGQISLKVSRDVIFALETNTDFDKASHRTVAYGVTPPATPRSILRKTTTFCIYARTSGDMVAASPSSRSLWIIYGGLVTNIPDKNFLTWESMNLAPVRALSSDFWRLE